MNYWQRLNVRHFELYVRKCVQQIDTVYADGEICTTLGRVVFAALLLVGYTQHAGRPYHVSIEADCS